MNLLFSVSNLVLFGEGLQLLFEDVRPDKQDVRPLCYVHDTFLLTQFLVDSRNKENFNTGI